MGQLSCRSPEDRIPDGVRTLGGDAVMDRLLRENDVGDDAPPADARDILCRGEVGVSETASRLRTALYLRSLRPIAVETVSTPVAGMAP